MEEVIEMLMLDDKGDGEVVPGAGGGDSGGAEELKHEPGEEPDGQDEDQPGKRPHVVVDNDVKGMVSRLQRALGMYAALLAPELFAGMHPDTPRKWKLRVAWGRGVHPGRPRALPADVFADSVMAVVFEAQLKALSHPPMAERSVREFLSKLDLSYRRKSITTKTYTAEEAGEAVREKLARHRRVTDHQLR